MKSCNAYEMYWDCNDPRKGCFNEKKRLKFAAFASCFSAVTPDTKINFTDVDAIVEINGRVLMLEWKDSPCPIWDTGQGKMFKRLSNQYGILVLCVAGNAENMTPTHLAAYFKNHWYPWKPYNLARLKSFITRWYRWALANPWRQ